MIKFLLGAVLVLPTHAFTIQVDYRFDTQGFFDAPGAKDAMEAAAARWSRIIDQELQAIDLRDEAQDDIRFNLFNPATGNRIDVSVAESAESDFVVQFRGPAADVYLGGFSLEEDVWVLFAGGRAFTSGEFASGGPIGLGATQRPNEIMNDPNSFVNRGFNVGADSLSVLGGAVAFSSTVNWNFDLSGPGEPGSVDFYSFALHEIGHGLGLSSGSGPEFMAFSSSGRYTGALAVEAHNIDNETELAGLEIQSLSGQDFHWRSGAHRARVFPLGFPNTVGVIEDGGLQNLLMDAGLSFSQAVPRLEVTNIEVGALRDVGWSVITEDPPEPPPLPLNFERSETGMIKLGIASVEGATYTVQTSSDGRIWQNVTPSLIGDGSMICWEDGQEGFTDPTGSAADLTEKFYRVREDGELLPDVQ